MDKLIDSSQISTLVQFFGALADETRLKLIGLLALKPTCGQDLATQLGVSAPTVSHHIHKLKKLDLVTSVREENTIFYALNTSRLTNSLKVSLRMRILCPLHLKTSARRFSVIFLRMVG